MSDDVLFQSRRLCTLRRHSRTSCSQFSSSEPWRYAVPESVSPTCLCRRWVLHSIHHALWYIQSYMSAVIRCRWNGCSTRRSGWMPPRRSSTRSGSASAGWSPSRATTIPRTTARGTRCSCRSVTAWRPFLHRLSSLPSLATRPSACTTLASKGNFCLENRILCHHGNKLAVRQGLSGDQERLRELGHIFHAYFYWHHRTTSSDFIPNKLGPQKYIFSLDEYALPNGVLKPDWKSENRGK